MLPMKPLDWASALYWISCGLQSNRARDARKAGILADAHLSFFWGTAGILNGLGHTLGTVLGPTVSTVRSARRRTRNQRSQKSSQSGCE
jgi:hypothetical protein